MLMDLNQKKIMPDVAQSQKASFLSPLKWVGMEKVAIPLTLTSGVSAQAEADIFVNVAKEDAKGIHMSRLYLAIHDYLEQKQLSMAVVKETLKQFVDSQEGLSNSAKIVLRWQEMHQRKALLSEYSGWKTYPVELEAELVEGKYKMSLNFSLMYSSACPCSAALARQLYQQAFAKEFCEDTLSFEKVFKWLGESQIAAPHSQRSQADIQVVLKESATDFSVLDFINKIEEDLKTPVQTAVKREDEQEFARLNGENTMFVEDALRIMENSMKTFSEVFFFEIKTHHYESLHAHDAVGTITSK